MGNEAYQQRKDIDLTPGEDGLIHVSKNIVVYLTKNQVEATWKSLCDYAEKNGRVKNFSQINNCIFVGNTGNIITPNSVYGKFSEDDVDTLENLNMVPKLNDANRLAQTDKDYNKDNPDYIPDDQNFPLKIWYWYDKGLIDKDQHNAIIRGILFSSGSIHNDWVYSLTGEDAGRDKDPVVLDMHDRRIDDPNVPLTVKGGVNVGDPDNATDRKKLSVFGETELQDGTTFGRLLDTFGEQFPMYFGHLIPDQGQYHKVYINRGEDRYNAEDWDDTDNTVEYWQYDTSGEKNEWKQIAKSEIPSGASIIAVNILPNEPAENTYYAIDVQIPYYGTGFGTIEAYREIVSHTTVNADRGIIIEDGLGDYTDKVIEKYTDKGNTFDPTGAQTHQTNGFALSVHHDGAKIKGHTYIQDEGSANLFFKEDNTIYKANASNPDGFDIVTDIKRDCWFCEIQNDEENDWQYIHYCTNKDNNIEPVVDRWPGHLYYDGILKIKGQEGWKYRIYFINEQQQKDYIEYYYQNGVFYVIESRKDTTSGQIYKINNNYFTSDKTLSEILTENGYLYKFKGEYTNDEDRYAERTADYPIYLVDELTIVEGQSELSYKGHIRVRPKTNKVYQINKAYTETNKLYGLVEVRLNELDEPIPYDANTYFYWDGIKFKPITKRRDLYNQKQDYGSLTIGTRANGEQDNDTIGRNSLEVGKENEATGDNAVANGQATTAAALNSHAEGLGTEVKSTGLLSHIEGLGDYSELVEYQDENDFFGEGGGRPSEVSGIASHAEGYGQKVEGKYSHAEGRLNQILGNDTIASHAEGSENIIEDTVGTSHAEGVLNKITKNKYDEQSPVNKFATEGAHVEGAGNIIDRRYQHLEGVLAKTTHDVDQYYDDGSTPTEKPVVFAIGDGDSPTRENAQGNTPADRIIENREDPAYKRSNLFAITEDGDTYIAGHLEVDGTSDLSGRATIGDSVANHGLALEVLKHSKFDQNVTIERDPAATSGSLEEKLDTQIGWESQNPPIDNSLKVKGKSLYGDTLTIGSAGSINGITPTEKGTFWGNLDNNAQYSEFIGLNVHGEIKNERIPEDLYTSMVVQGERKFNEFADKFWTNSSIATATATYRGCYTKADYDPDGTGVDPEDPEEMAKWLDQNVNPFVPGNVLDFASFDDLPNPKNYWQYIVAGSRWNKVENVPAGATIEVVYALPTNGEANKYYELNATMNVIYHVLGVNKYYQWVWDDDTHTTGDYTEVSATPDNNDYCFVQIEEDSLILPYVLFPDTDQNGEEVGNSEDPLELSGTETDGKNIITHRYKYVQILDPLTGEVLNQGWRFEYQLNNSGFTQAQWNAINSGITNTWKTSIENSITNLGIRINQVNSDLTKAIDDERQARIDADGVLNNKFLLYVTLAEDETISGTKNFTSTAGVRLEGVYLKKNTNSSGTFLLPNRAGETLLSTSDLNGYATETYVTNAIANIDLSKYLKFDATASRNEWLATTGVPEFKVGLITGRTTNGTYYYSALLPGENGVKYCLPGGAEGRKLAEDLKVVHSTGDEPVSGLKTFTDGIILGSGTTSGLQPGAQGNYKLPGGSGNGKELALKSDITTLIKTGVLYGVYKVNNDSKSVNVSGNVVREAGSFVVGNTTYSYKYTFNGSKSFQSINSTNAQHTLVFQKARVGSNTFTFTNNATNVYLHTYDNSTIDEGESITFTNLTKSKYQNQLKLEWNMTSWFNGRELVSIVDITWYSNT